MRKFTTLVLMSLSLAVSAQDIIVTRDNKRIDANITEVSGDNIRYKKANSPDGPVFVMPVKDINSIVYKNGDVQTFEETAATQSQPAAVKKSEPAPKSEVANEKIIYTAAEFTGDTLPRFEYKKVFIPEKGKMKKRYCGGNMVLKGKEFSKFLDVYCHDVHKRETKSSIFSAIGASTLLAGCLASTFFISSDPMISLGVIGAACAVSLPFDIVALHYGSNILEHYNATCAGTPVKKQ